MFRLLKLMAFALFGYALYEFVRGMSSTGGMGGEMGGREEAQGSSAEAFGQETGFGQITGAGTGREDATLDPDGGSVKHRVGRGVVRR